MSFLGSLLGNVVGNSSEHEGVAQALLTHLQNSQTGGLPELIQRFQANGLAQQAESWIGTGTNQQITPDQAEQGLGTDRLQQLASRAGVSPGVAKIALAAILPMVINHLTPDGNIPSQPSLAQRIAGLLPRS